MLTNVNIPIKWLERRVTQNNMTWGGIHKFSEGGYMCGSKVPGDKFYVQRKLFCGEYIESIY